jgi:hypothetical protein
MATRRAEGDTVKGAARPPRPPGPGRSLRTLLSMLPFRRT